MNDQSSYSLLRERSIYPLKPVAKLTLGMAQVIPSLKSPAGRTMRHGQITRPGFGFHLLETVATGVDCLACDQKMIESTSTSA